MSVPKLRLVTGSCLATLFALIVLSEKNDLVLLLLMLIPTKVFQELRRINLAPDQVQQEKSQIMFDWLLYSVTLFCACNIIWFDIRNLYYGFLLYLSCNQNAIKQDSLGVTNGFVSWIFFVLNKNIQNLMPYLLHTFWIHMAIVYTLIQPILISWNISNGGLFWFVFPCSLVICNDVAAYFCGKCYGKHRLLDLSPNKTLEGYIGAIFITVLFGASFAPWLSRFDSFMANKDVQDIQIHAAYLSLFASVFAPFGGFFASALKRASQIKDFGNLLPGHGGFADRVDCHLFMALFTFLYYKSFVMN